MKNGKKIMKECNERMKNGKNNERMKWKWKMGKFIMKERNERMKNGKNL